MARKRCYRKKIWAIYSAGAGMKGYGSIKTARNKADADRLARVMYGHRGKSKYLGFRKCKK